MTRKNTLWWESVDFRNRERSGVKRRWRIREENHSGNGGSFLLAAADGLVDHTPPSDRIVVLGNEVTSDGQPSSRLGARLDRAVELHEAGLASAILVSGVAGARI